MFSEREDSSASGAAEYAQHLINESYFKQGYKFCTSVQTQKREDRRQRVRRAEQLCQLFSSRLIVLEGSKAGGTFREVSHPAKGWCLS